MLTASLGHLPGTARGQQCPGLDSLAGFALGTVLFTGINGFFPALPELGSHRQPPASLLFLPTLSIFGFQPLHLFPASSPFCSRCNRHKQGGEGGAAQWEGDNCSCCSLVPLLHGLLQTKTLLFPFESSFLICAGATAQYRAGALEKFPAEAMERL